METLDFHPYKMLCFPSKTIFTILRLKDLRYMYSISGPNQEGCEEIEISSGDGADCDQSTYGCCPDGVTMAQGPSNEGCDGVVVEVPDTDVYYPDRERVNVDVTSGKI